MASVLVLIMIVMDDGDFGKRVMCLQGAGSWCGRST